jgi:glycosyltransferase involved in cell wall biosynthesis
MIRNVLICTTQVPFTTGGAESHVAGLQHAFTAAGYNAEIVALPFKWYPPTEIMRGSLAWRLLDLTESNGKPIDLVVGMKFPAYIVEHPRKVLWVMHQYRAAYNLWGTPFDDLSMHPEGHRLREWIHNCDNQFIPRAKKVFANSQTVAARLLKYNGIESEPLYHPPPRASQLRTGEYGDYVLYPSRVEPQKRQELLIEAMRYTKTAVKVILAGSSGDAKHYESLIKQHQVEEKVSLTGFVEEERLIDLYANALAVCYLPFDEDYGYVSLEAMIAAKPLVVAKDSGGAAELVEDKLDAFVVDPDPRAIADALDNLYTDRALAQKMGTRGRENFLARNISWSNVVEKIISASLRST